MNARSRDGFTLIELMIVVVVIGILAAIAIPKFKSVRERAFMSSIKTDLRNMSNLQEVYYNEHFTYATDASALGFTNSEGSFVSLVEGDNTGWSASATHPGVPGESCAIYHGDATQLAPANVESVVLCSR
jgi:prepilin-type N-terminal cleavage/methylation domain-containing protein